MSGANDAELRGIATALVGECSGHCQATKRDYATCVNYLVYEAQQVVGEAAALSTDDRRRAEARMVAHTGAHKRGLWRSDNKAATGAESSGTSSGNG